MTIVHFQLVATFIVGRFSEISGCTLCVLDKVLGDLESCFEVYVNIFVRRL